MAAAPISSGGGVATVPRQCTARFRSTLNRNCLNGDAKVTLLEDALEEALVKPPPLIGTISTLGGANCRWVEGVEGVEGGHRYPCSACSTLGTLGTLGTGGVLVDGLSLADVHGGMSAMPV